MIEKLESLSDSGKLIYIEKFILDSDDEDIVAELIALRAKLQPEMQDAEPLPEIDTTPVSEIPKIEEIVEIEEEKTETQVFSYTLGSEFDKAIDHYVNLPAEKHLEAKEIRRPEPVNFKELDVFHGQQIKESYKVEKEQEGIISRQKYLKKLEKELMRELE